MRLITVVGPAGVGKTRWISQFFQERQRPLLYYCPGFNSVDQARIDAQFPWVTIVPEDQVKQVFDTLPDQAVVYLELEANLDLGSPFLTSLPCHRVAVLPPDFQQTSAWHNWADEIIPGNNIPVTPPDDSQELWRIPLIGHVFDPPSLDEALIEVTEGAYGRVQRMKGIFELPDGHAFYLDFVEGLPGIEYTELNLASWLDGRPDRFSGIEVRGWNLDKEGIVQTLVDGGLSDTAIAQYQEHYKAERAHQTNPQENILR
ncbi:MAG: GTP-binding protein [Synechococcaceae cyanobacterium RL_1_2]|nr:GTP-binding protein [Synechococcaceae cyanobacterium RL_1_2]